jgi:D-glycero-D-manno-heptose 1,7-bisphosphate phosphatase
VEDKPLSSLFLDRDGVINLRTPGEYVLGWEEFSFLPGVFEALSIFDRLFRYIFVITNQACVEKEMLPAATLEEIHRQMLAEIGKQGGRIDRVYYCPHRHESGCECRKPGTGMVKQAMAEFEGVDPGRSFLAGDSLSDIQVGIRMGMRTVWIDTKEEDRPLMADAIGAGAGFYLSGHYPDLLSFALELAAGPDALLEKNSIKG